MKNTGLGVLDDILMRLSTAYVSNHIFKLKKINSLLCACVRVHARVHALVCSCTRHSPGEGGGSHGKAAR